MTLSTTGKVLRLLEVPALIVAPLALLLCAQFQTDQSALLSSIPTFLCVILFFASFEASHPPLRQIMPTVVMAALAAAGRIVFAPIPNVQPMGAIAIMAGVVFGKRSGFLVGALAVFVSNFFMGQGPWTAWQMYGFGLMGYLAGVLEGAGAFNKKGLLYGYAFLAPIVEYGLLLNSWYLVGYIHPITWQSALLAYGMGLPADLTHAIACVIFLLVLYAPWKKKLERIKHKFDLVECN